MADRTQHHIGPNNRPSPIMGKGGNNKKQRGSNKKPTYQFNNIHDASTVVQTTSEGALQMLKQHGWAVVDTGRAGIVTPEDIASTSEALVGRILDNLTKQCGPKPIKLVRSDLEKKRSIAWFYRRPDRVKALTERLGMAEEEAKAIADKFMVHIRGPSISQGDGMGYACNIYDIAEQVALEEKFRPLFALAHGVDPSMIKMEYERCSLKAVNGASGAAVPHVDMSVPGPRPDGEWARRGPHTATAHGPKQRLQGFVVGEGGDGSIAFVTGIANNHQALIDVMPEEHAKHSRMVHEQGHDPKHGPLAVSVEQMQQLQAKGFTYDLVQGLKPGMAVVWWCGTVHASGPMDEAGAPVLKMYVNYTVLDALSKPEYPGDAPRETRVIGMGNHTK